MHNVSSFIILSSLRSGSVVRKCVRCAQINGPPSKVRQYFTTAVDTHVQDKSITDHLVA